MPRMLLGAIAAAVAMFILGFIFFATPLQFIGFGSVDAAQSANLQAALAQNIAATGTYVVPIRPAPKAPCFTARARSRWSITTAWALPSPTWAC